MPPSSTSTACTARRRISLACGAEAGISTSAAMIAPSAGNASSACDAGAAAVEHERVEVGQAGELVLGTVLAARTRSSSASMSDPLRDGEGGDGGSSSARASRSRARESRTAKVAALQPAARAASAVESPSQATRQIASRSRSPSRRRHARARGRRRRARRDRRSRGRRARIPRRAALRRWLASTLPATAYSHGRGCSIRRGNLRHATTKVSAARSSTSSRATRRAKYAQMAA